MTSVLSSLFYQLLLFLSSSFSLSIASFLFFLVNSGAGFRQVAAIGCSVGAERPVFLGFFKVWSTEGACVKMRMSLVDLRNFSGLFFQDFSFSLCIDRVLTRNDGALCPFCIFDI